MSTLGSWVSPARTHTPLSTRPASGSESLTALLLFEGADDVAAAAAVAAEDAVEVEKGLDPP
jgi:hypothetical protein